MSGKTDHRLFLRLNRTAEGRSGRRPAAKNALLSVSKHISHEACAVLYGGHKFKLATAQALDWFLIHIGENRQHVRHVRVMNWVDMCDLPAVGRVADNLLDAKNLRSLTLRPRVVTYIDTDRKTIRFFGDSGIDQGDVGAIITELALVSVKLLKSLHRAQKSEDKLAGVIKIFHLAFNPYESELRQLSVVWKNAVQLCIIESEP